MPFSGSALQLKVRSIGDTICTVEAQASWSVQDVKQAIEDASGILAIEQRLICGATEIQNWDPISQHVKDGQAEAVITLLRRQVNNPLWVGRVVAGKADGLRLAFAPHHIRCDRQVVLAAVQNTGRALEYAADELRCDKEVVLAAVQNDGMALSYAHPFLKEDRQVLKAALKQAGASLQFAPHHLQSDLEIVLIAINSDPLVVERVQPELQRHPEVLAALKREPTQRLKPAGTAGMADVPKWGLDSGGWIAFLACPAALCRGSTQQPPK